MLELHELIQLPSVMAGPADLSLSARRISTRRQPAGCQEEQVNHMTSAVASGGSSSRRVLAAILAVLGILGIIAGILYAAGVANHLHFMVGSTHKGHHQVRLAISFVLGIVLLASAWFVSRGGSRARH